MKSILLLISLFLCVATDAQEKLLTFREAMQVPGATREQIFLAARKWFVQSFPNSKGKFLKEDKESGELSANAVTTIPVSHPQDSKKTRDLEARFSANFIFKDGTCQYEFTDIEVRGQGKTKFQKLWTDKKADDDMEAMKESVKKHFEGSANSFKTVMDNLN